MSTAAKGSKKIAPPSTVVFTKSKICRMARCVLFFTPEPCARQRASPMKSSLDVLGGGCRSRLQPLDTLDSRFVTSRASAAIIFAVQ